jgi:hypothetical protein
LSAKVLSCKQKSASNVAVCKWACSSRCWRSEACTLPLPRSPASRIPPPSRTAAPLPTPRCISSLPSRGRPPRQSTVSEMPSSRRAVVSSLMSTQVHSSSSSAKMGLLKLKFTTWTGSAVAARSRKKTYRTQRTARGSKAGGPASGPLARSTKVEYYRAIHDNDDLLEEGPSHVY